MYMLLEFMFLCRKINQSRLPQDLEKCRISHETQEDNNTMKKESNGIYSQSQRNIYFCTGNAACACFLVQWFVRREENI